MDRMEIAPGVFVTNDRCLFFQKEGAVVVGDLHLGYEKALEEDGMYIPRVNTESVRDSLNRILYKYEPKKVILLGDIKHDFHRAGYEGREEVLSIVSLIQDAAEVVLVKGNHDNYLQNIISKTGLSAVDYYDLAGYRLEHGHFDSGKRPVVIGHEHPSVKIQGAVSGGMKIQCFLHLEKEGIIVIPPFSPLSSGTDLLPCSSEDFMSPACKSAEIDKAQVYGISELGIIPLGELSAISEIRI